MNSIFDSDNESTDVERVDAALNAMSEGEYDKAESLLMAVIDNTPLEYANYEETQDSISIKFWDQRSFMHYVAWRKEHDPLEKGLFWINNAYPRAHYFMGFLCVRLKQFDRAIDLLEKGRKLEPTNPKFTFEIAQALARSGHEKKALDMYDKITEISAYVSPNDIAIAQRGRGFALLESGDLDNAEIAYKTSLEIEPDNEIALNELRYIEHLRKGGAAVEIE